jgi:hypothetical protein
MLMARVEVWLENTEAIKLVRRSEKGENVYAAIPAQKKLLGRCEATAKAVAELCGIDESIAAEALAHPGEPVFLCEWSVPPLVVNLYLVVYPIQKSTQKHKRK